MSRVIFRTWGICPRLTTCAHNGGKCGYLSNFACYTLQCSNVAFPYFGLRTIRSAVVRPSAHVITRPMLPPHVQPSNPHLQARFWRVGNHVMPHALHLRRIAAPRFVLILPFLTVFTLPHSGQGVPSPDVLGIIILSSPPPARPALVTRGATVFRFQIALHSLGM